jgi:adenylosuccinate synthase
MEDRLGKSSIGTTRKGITPAYVDKIGRRGVRMGDLKGSKLRLRELLSEKIRENNRVLRRSGLEPLPLKRSVETLAAATAKIASLVTDTRLAIWSGLQNNKRILGEGAQGTLLDVDHGTYPFVTSSSASVGGAVLGSGIPPQAIDRVIGIFKAYCTRVGNGPFPTEDRGKTGSELRRLGCEYGTTTGRPRRCGWFDGVAGRTVVKLNGISEIALTKLDVLDSFDRIKVCRAYRFGKETLEYFPTSVRTLERCKPEYDIAEGWVQDTDGNESATLPRAAEDYVARLEKLVGCRIRLISLGPDRQAVIDRA